MSEVKSNPPLPTDTVLNRAALPSWQLLQPSPKGNLSNFQVKLIRATVERNRRARRRPHTPSFITPELPDEWSRCRLRPCRLDSR